MRLDGAADAARVEEACRRAMADLGWAPARLVVARTFPERLVGMRGRAAGAGRGHGVVLAFPDCSSVHTWGMRRPLDIAFADADGEVLLLREGVAPCRVLWCRGARIALERASPGAVLADQFGGLEKSPLTASRFLL